MIPPRRVTLYFLFAALATATNLGTQRLVLLCAHGRLAVYGAIVAGTAVGLVSKFLLDGRFVFHYVPRSAAHGIETFALYCALSVLTTLVSRVVGHDAASRRNRVL